MNAMNAIIETVLLGLLFGWLIITIPLPIVLGIMLDCQECSHSRP
jgi:hypothetical protein